MAIKRDWKSAGLIVGSVLFLFVIFAIVGSLLSPTVPVKDLLWQSLNLRNDVDQLTRADAVAVMDDLVASAGNVELSDQWERVTECLGSGCPDEAFLDLLLVIAVEFEQDYEYSALLINVIAAHRYWKSEEVIEFSKAVSIADDQIVSLKDKKAQKAWSEILACTDCPNRNDLFFVLLGEIIQK